jgi:hypothetical protein
MMMRRIFLAGSCWLILAIPARGQESGEAMKLSDIITLLGAGEIKRDFLQQMVRESCVDFPVDAEAARQLRAAGADDAFLNVARNACFAGAEVVVESRPAGAGVSINGKSVGNAPWTGRFLPGASVRVAVSAYGKTSSQTLTLRPRERTRTLIGFTEDTLPLPAMRPISTIIAQLGLERQWTPSKGEPSPPELHEGTATLLGLGITFGGAGYGAYRCSQMTEGCFVEPKIDPETGLDANKDTRTLVGGASGFVAGLVVNWAFQKIWDRVDTYGYNAAVKRHASWVERDAEARNKWMLAHPALRAEIASDAAARNRVVAQNNQIKERNRSIPASSTMTEALPGPPK